MFSSVCGLLLGLCRISRIPVPTCFLAKAVLRCIFVDIDFEFLLHIPWTGYYGHESCWRWEVLFFLAGYYNRLWTSENVPFRENRGAHRKRNGQFCSYSRLVMLRNLQPIVLGVVQRNNRIGETRAKRACESLDHYPPGSHLFVIFPLLSSKYVILRFSKNKMRQMLKNMS